jgi:hypothetical protein
MILIIQTPGIPACGGVPCHCARGDAVTLGGQRHAGKHAGQR